MNANNFFQLPFKIQRVAWATSLLLIGVTDLVYAQEQGASENDNKKIVITGSRIPRTELSTPVPVVTLGAADLEATGFDTLEDVLAELPQLVPGVTSSNSQNGTDRAGQNVLELRDLGSDRTLVLIDGKRVVSTRTGSLQVDTNTIPTDFIKRIEVLTGGASAIYGSEAIAGVVNIVTKDSFDGLRFRARKGDSSDGGAEVNSGGVTGGGTFADGKGSAMFNASFYSRERLSTRDRTPVPLSIDPQTNEVVFGGSTNIPSGQWRAIRASGSQNQSAIELVQGTDGSWADINDSNSLEDFNNGSTDRYNFNEFGDLRTPLERYSFAGKLKYDLTSTTTFSGSAQFTTTDINTQRTAEAVDHSEYYNNTPRADYQIPIDHPLIPVALRDAALALGSASNPTTGLEFLNRRLTELGPRTTDNTRQTFRILSALEGEVYDDFNWELSYTFGQTLQSQVISGNTVINNVRDGLNIEDILDSTGNPTGEYQCADGQARSRGCVPVNLFGRDTLTPEMVDWIIDSSTLRGKLQQQAFLATIGGEIAELEAGSVGILGGIEYRRDRSETLTDSLLNNQGETFVAVPNNGGAISVKEAFAEIVVPLLSDAPGAKYLEFNAAGRVSDYSLENVNSVFSFKTGFAWSPIDELRVRTGFARANRAPNILEAFSVPRTTATSFRDPCDNVTATNNGRGGTQISGDNCRAVAAIADAIAADGRFDRPTDLSDRGRNLGNPTLEEETADTKTFGLVFSPTNDLQISADYYEIEIEDAILGSSRTEALTNCYNSVGLTDPDCALITRSTLDGQITFVDSIDRNADLQRVEGIDLYLGYKTDLSNFFDGVPGSLSLDLNYSHALTNEIIRTNTAGEETITDEKGEIDSPEDNARLNIGYRNGDFRFNWRMVLIGKNNADNQGYEEDVETVAQQQADGLDPSDEDYINPAYLDRYLVSSLIYHNVSASYRFGENDNYRVQLSINNLTDKKPPFIGSGLGSSACNSDCGTYNTTGRFVNLSLRADF